MLLVECFPALNEVVMKVCLDHDDDDDDDSETHDPMYFVDWLFSIAWSDRGLFLGRGGCMRFGSYGVCKTFAAF